MNARPTVAHLMRGYLAPTETFIGNQIFSLTSYRPVILCHHRYPNPSYPAPSVYAATELLPRHQLLLDWLAYRFARRMTSAGVTALSRRAHAESVRLLHIHFLVDARYFLDLKRRLDLPAVVSVYGYDVSSFPRQFGGYGRRYLQPIWHEIEVFIAMSYDMKRDLARLGCPEDRIVVHFYGTPTARFAYPDRCYEQPEVVEILSCGSLEVKKAQHLVLEALHRLKQSDPNLPAFHVTFAGDGPMRGSLEAMVREYGWHDRVTFAGHVPHHENRLVELYRQADVFTLPSITVAGDKEGIPTVLAEAMASGLPCVTTYHAGIPELVEPDQHGLLVQEGDTDGLAAAFGRLLRDPTLRARLGRAGAEKARRACDLPARTTNLERIYAAALEGRAAAQLRV